ncbi:MAG: hypothetical protein JNJ57_06435 [Saprospiraceae bacterium]|nr:hypothetical protein [Saprospiraceae bacterium]
MKQLLIFACLSTIALFSSCSKEPALQEQSATGPQLLSSRAPNTYYHHLGYSNGKFGYKIDIFSGGVQVYAGEYQWVNLSGTQISVPYLGDNDNSYTYRVHYVRKVPSIPVGVSTNWSSECHSLGEGEYVNIPVGGTYRTHTFSACDF